MNFFSRTPANPKAGLSLNDYMSRLQKAPIYVQYKALVGGPIAQAHASVLFDNAVRSKDREGFWMYNPTGDNLGEAAAPDTAIRFKPSGVQSQDTFWDMIVFPNFTNDYKKIIARQPYMASLRTHAFQGLLFVRLETNKEPEASYWPAGVAKMNRDKKGDVLNLEKAKHWVKFEIERDSRQTPKSNAHSVQESQSLVARYARKDAAWPLSFKILSDISAELVKGGPRYRAATDGDNPPYPSNFGGTFLLLEALDNVASKSLPRRGDRRWASWAIYAYAAIMAAQAFADGNKRVARIAYAVVMASGGLDFRAPTGKLRTQLANMGQL